MGFYLAWLLPGSRKCPELPEDSFEVLQDLVTISQASEEDDNEDELNEVAYVDIVEYVRMCILLINEELQPMNGPVPRSNNTIFP